jgi:hypothetical protein
MRISFERDIADSSDRMSQCEASGGAAMLFSLGDHRFTALGDPALLFRHRKLPLANGLVEIS